MLTWVEISASALLYNIRLFKKLLKPETDIMAVIKSNAYGHDMKLIASLCENNQSIKTFGVASLNEALKLITEGIKKPIIILSFFEVKDLLKISQSKLNQIRLPLYDMVTAKKIRKILQKKKLTARVHIKIDTGTTRIGFFPSQAGDIIKYIKANTKYFQLEGLYTHFANAEEDIKFTIKQAKIFRNVYDIFSQAGFKNLITHTACTASTLNYLPSHGSMIRLGLGLYGLNPTSAIKRMIYKQTGAALKPVLAWKTKLIQVKTINKNTTVGYGRTYKALNKIKIGILPIGYYDGYDRKLSNKGKVLVGESLCKVAGRICMNLTMIELPNKKNLKAGSEVILIDPKHSTINADKMAKDAGTIQYEIITRINSQIPRVQVI